jgi:sec-independent protein translocase protein TatA|tara:strand:+ start:83 stop:262 length:180 start_codon:yes stop_codon:yes gene_type:complete
MGQPGLWEILIILMVLLVLFGGNKIRNMGSDLGESLKGFKKAIKDEDTESKPESDSEDK